MYVKKLSYVSVYPSGIRKGALLTIQKIRQLSLTGNRDHIIKVLFRSPHPATEYTCAIIINNHLRRQDFQLLIVWMPFVHPECERAGASHLLGKHWLKYPKHIIKRLVYGVFSIHVFYIYPIHLQYSSPVRYGNRPGPGEHEHVLPFLYNDVVYLIRSLFQFIVLAAIAHRHSS